MARPTDEVLDQAVKAALVFYHPVLPDSDAFRSAIEAALMTVLCER
jgi:hypothetical protein